MKIGLYGGTFNPPHVGHVITAEFVRHSLQLDKVIFIPSYISPHKKEGEADVADHRWEMTKRAVRGNLHFEVSDIELQQKEISYTVHTLEWFVSKNPTGEFFVIIGMDNYLTFHQWKDPRRILDLATLAVMTRPGYAKQVNENIGSDKTVFVDVPEVDLSSSEIRRKVSRGESIRTLVDPDVEEYISHYSLYR